MTLTVSFALFEGLTVCFTWPEGATSCGDMRTQETAENIPSELLGDCQSYVRDKPSVHH